MKSIGIDIGTTTISFVITDNDTLTVLQKYTIAGNSFIQTGNSWERIQDTDVILSRIRPVLHEILDTYSDISAIGITSQMHGIVYTDSGGHAVSPLYTWQDGRGALPEFNGRSLLRSYKMKKRPHMGPLCVHYMLQDSCLSVSFRFNRFSLSFFLLCYLELDVDAQRIDDYAF